MDESKDKFLSVENMKLCQSVLAKYMASEYQFDIATDGAKTNVKKMLFDIMQDVNKKYAKSPQMSLRDMNNVTLNIARDYYASNYKLRKHQTPKPDMRTLEREQNVYGSRPMNTEQLKPVAGFPPSKQEVSSAFEKLDIERRNESATTGITVPDEIKPLMETAYDPLEFQKRLDELEKRRNEVDIKDLTTINENRRRQDSNAYKTIANDPKKLYQMTTSENTKAESKRQSYEEANRNISRMEVLAPPVTQQILIDKFLSINGFDRNWTAEPKRFHFKVDFNFGDNSIQQRFRNIKSIKASRVIIPLEIEEQRTIHNVPKSAFNFDFSMSYPYLLLNIDEFNDVYDGTNQNARNCFCHLVYDKCFRSKNGRGYIILNTIQQERKVFHPTPLSSLSKMNVSIRKPNGELLNQSRDNYNIFMVEYDAYNKQYFKIVTDKYYDKNEFFRGDTVRFTDYQAVNNTAGMSDEAIMKLNDFINRPEGHEIVEVGQANDSGFYRNFYITGPGYFDTTAGSFVLDSAIVSNLMTYNASIDFNTFTGYNGSIMNTSLQVSLTFKLQVVATDPGLVDTSFFSKQKNNELA